MRSREDHWVARNMEKLTAYLISAGILAFGIWIVANAELRWGSLMFGSLLAWPRSRSERQTSSMKSTARGKLLKAFIQTESQTRRNFANARRRNLHLGAICRDAARARRMRSRSSFIDQRSGPPCLCFLRLRLDFDPLKSRGFQLHLPLPRVSRFGDGNVQLSCPVANGISATLHFDGNLRQAEPGGRQRSQSLGVSRLPRGAAHFSPSARVSIRRRMPRVCELSSYQDARALKPDRFIVQFALINREDLTGTVSHRIAGLRQKLPAERPARASRNMFHLLD
jgi:hypothetical protein